MTDHKKRQNPGANDDANLASAPDELIISADTWDDLEFNPNSDEETVEEPESTEPTEAAADLDDETPIAQSPFGSAPEERRITVKKDLQSRVDVYLQNRLKGISRSRVQKLIDLGGVKINGKLPKASTKIRAGDEIDITLPAKAVKRIIAEEIPLDVLFEDEHLIVINKQANLIVHPARSQTSGTLLNGLAWRFKQNVEAAGHQYQERQTRGFAPTSNKNLHKPIFKDDGAVPGLSNVGVKEFRPGIVHRLDKNTTGCIVVAKSDQAHWGIAKQFEDRSTLKAYLAVVTATSTRPAAPSNSPSAHTRPSKKHSPSDTTQSRNTRSPTTAFASNTKATLSSNSNSKPAGHTRSESTWATPATPSSGTSSTAAKPSDTQNSTNHKSPPATADSSTSQETKKPAKKPSARQRQKKTSSSPPPPSTQASFNSSTRSPKRPCASPPPCTNPWPASSANSANGHPKCRW